ncbi:hypothetical protein ACLOJK_004980 [Asimina triloba]
MPSSRRGGTELLPFDSEPEQTLHKRRRDRVREFLPSETMEGTDGHQTPGLPEPQQHVNDRAINEFIAPGLDYINSSIRRPAIEANNFELKPIMFQMLQTAG